MKKIVMIRSLIIAIVMAVSGLIPSYGQGIIEGNVTDGNGSPVAYANIIAKNASDSTFISGAISDTVGNFRLSVPRGGEVMLQATCIGYEDLYAKADRKTVKLVMRESSTALKGVTVTGSLPRHTMTREGMMTNVAGTVLGKAGTAEDVLKHIPNIAKKKDNWEVFGKGTPLIYVNGRQLHDISELDNISSSEIKNVEVIRNPGAKYPASVNAVIRIKTLRKNGEGFGLNVRSTYRYNRYNNAIEQVDANYRHDNLYMFATYLYSNTNSLQDATFEQTVFVDTLWKHYMTNYDRNHTEYHYLCGGLSYDIGEKHSFGARYSVVLTGKEYDDGWMNNNVVANDKPYDNLFSTVLDRMEDRPTHRLNMYYEGKWGATDIDFNADLYYNHGVTYSDINEESQDYDSRIFTAKSETKNRMFASKLVLTTPIGKGSLEYGAEAVSTKSESHYAPNQTNIIEEALSNIKENSLSVFTEYSLPTKIGEFTAGVRYEDVNFKYYENDVYQPEQSRTFHNIYPSLQYSKQIGKTSWQLGYTAKTRRPSFQQLSSNTSYSNRFTLQSGNPLLKHQTTHSVSLSGAWNFMQWSVEYSDIRDAIIYWMEQKPDNEATTIVRYKNVKSIKGLTTAITAAPKIGIWSPQLSLAMQKQWFTVNSGAKEHKLNKPIFVASASNALSLPWGVTLNVDFSFQGKGHSQNAEVIKNQYVLDCGISKSFLKDALTLEVKGYDLFYQEWDSGLVYSEKMQFQQICRRGSRRLSVTLRYKFNTTNKRYKGTGAGSSTLNRL